MNFRFRLPSLGLALALLLGLLLPIAPARADAGRWLGSPSYAELSAELSSLRPGTGAQARTLSPDQQKRYDDLLALQAAIVRSDDRAQVDNRSQHSVGIFARSKKAPADASYEFLVLGPGHENDDDFDLIGIYLPAGVSLEWGDGHGVAAATSPRLARLLEGQRLVVSDPAPAEPATTSPATASPATTSPAKTSYTTTSPAKTSLATTPPATASSAYRLDLPTFAVVSTSDKVAAVPALSQDDLDAHPETAPVD